MYILAFLHISLFHSANIQLRTAGLWYNINGSDNMNFKRLEKNLIDNIGEAHLKLDYDRRAISFNYMYSSLSHLLGCEVSAENSARITADFAAYTASRLGELTFRSIKSGICITVPPVGSEYVRDNCPCSPFFTEFIKLISTHGASLDDVTALFHRYSDNVQTEDKSSTGEFDMLIYFADSVPDDYRYCIAVDDDFGCSHLSYHRFIPEDYLDLGF